MYEWIGISFTIQKRRRKDESFSARGPDWSDSQCADRASYSLTLSDERHRQLSHRLEELRSALPGIEQLKQSAQEATAKAREAGNDLGEQLQESASKLTHFTQEYLNTAQQKGASSDNK